MSMVLFKPLGSQLSCRMQADLPAEMAAGLAVCYGSHVWRHHEAAAAQMLSSSVLLGSIVSVMKLWLVYMQVSAAIVMDRFAARHSNLSPVTETTSC